MYVHFCSLHVRACMSPCSAFREACVRICFAKTGTTPCHVCNHFYNHYILCLTCVWHSLMVEYKSSLWKIDAGALPYWPSQWRKTAAEPGSYRKNVNMGNMTLKTTLAALSGVCVYVRCTSACVCVWEEAAAVTTKGCRRIFFFLITVAQMPWWLL